MNYQSTRGKSGESLTSAQIIKQGLALDGGLFIPDEIPTVTLDEIKALASLSYPERAATILSKYLTDYTYGELLSDCREAYSEASFPGGAAPVVKAKDGIYSLELWHGPTAAFKDMALQIMPRLLSRALTKTGEERTALILVATSGDTGKAALEGYKDVEKIKIMVFYPVDGVSRVQKMQMATQTGDNVNVTAIYGNFDDAQTGVKKIFSDNDAVAYLNDKGYFFSSANSINWGRLAPQIVYYFSAYCDLVTKGEIALGNKINVCVPTGNFGNIFAAYLAKLMGLPIAKLVCASNQNNILTDFLTTGRYDRNRDFHCTMSPSMDILISSNLERLLALTAGKEATAEYMADLSSKGVYEVSSDVKAKISENFFGYFADETETAATIKKYFTEEGYLADTHTAVALCSAEKYIAESGDNTPMVVASTASPYKFAADVCASLGLEKPEDDLDALDMLVNATNTEIPYPLKGIAERTVRFTETVKAEEMLKAVKAYINE